MAGGYAEILSSFKLGLPANIDTVVMRVRRSVHSSISPGNGRRHDRDDRGTRCWLQMVNLLNGRRSDKGRRAQLRLRWRWGCVKIGAGRFDVSSTAAGRIRLLDPRTWVAVVQHALGAIDSERALVEPPATGPRSRSGIDLLFVMRPPLRRRLLCNRRCERQGLTPRRDPPA
jgi:hypothetical protein